MFFFLKHLNFKFHDVMHDSVKPKLIFFITWLRKLVELVLVYYHTFIEEEAIPKKMVSCVSSIITTIINLTVP